MSFKPLPPSRIIRDAQRRAIREHPDAETGTAADPAAVERELSEIRGLILQGGFGALDDRLRELVTEARKPPVTVTMRVEVPVEMPVTGQQAIHRAQRTGKNATWRKLFDVRNATLGARETEIWDGSHPDTPAIVTDYVWP